MKLIDLIFEPLQRALTPENDLDVWDPLFEDAPSTWPNAADQQRAEDTSPTSH